MAALILVPLIANSFGYNLVTIPVGKGLKNADLHAVYVFIREIADQIIEIIGLIGDSDSVLHALQKLHYTYIPHEYLWLESTVSHSVWAWNKVQE